jgi:hypothetical protein
MQRNFHLGWRRTRHGRLRDSDGFVEESEKIPTFPQLSPEETVYRSGNCRFGNLLFSRRWDTIAGNRDDRVIGQAAANNRGCMGEGAPFVRERNRSEHEDGGDTHTLSELYVYVNY